MTELEYREIEARLDDALSVFSDCRVFLGSEERSIYQNLMTARTELHGLRLELESEGVA
jgi:hypothetical protein